MRTSIGNERPGDAADLDGNGAPDLAERQFGKDGEAAPEPAAGGSRPGKAVVPDDGGPESARASNGVVSQRPSNH